MERKIITVGDVNSSGGKVISGSAPHTIMGKAIARMGDMVDCPAKYPGGKPHDVNPIVEGVTNFPIHGVPVAVEGFKSACGCTLLGSAPATTHIAGISRLAMPVTAAPSVGFCADEGQPEFHEQVRLKNKAGQPMANVPFHITDEKGNTFQGLTDAHGCCARVYTDGVQTLKVLTGVLALEKW